MRNPATYRRTAAATGLVASALIMLFSTVLAPDFPSGMADRLAAIDDGGSAAAVSAFAFALAQLPFIAAALGIGHLIRHRAPVLSNLGTTLALVGAFGHSVFGGVSIVQLSMAADETHRAVHADVLGAVESGPAVAFMAMGLLGTVLGVLLLSIGLWRSRVAPRWVPPALWAFLVVEFLGSAISDWSSSLSALIYVVTLTALAVTVARSPETLWRTGEAPPVPTTTVVSAESTA